MNYANQIGYTDVRPYEVVKTISLKTLEVREMNAVKDESVKQEFIPGGFSAYCTNNFDQKWVITSDTSNPVIRIRRSVNNGWQDKDGRRFNLSDAPRKFYDYNF